VLDKTGSLSVSFPVQIIYRIVSYRFQTTGIAIDVANAESKQATKKCAAFNSGVALDFHSFRVFSVGLDGRIAPNTSLTIGWSLCDCLYGNGLKGWDFGGALPHTVCLYKKILPEKYTRKTYHDNNAISSSATVTLDRSRNLQLSLQISFMIGDRAAHSCLHGITD